jgi:hypothetical protein
MRTLASLDFYEDFHLRERNFSDIHGSLEFQPADFLSCQLRGQFASAGLSPRALTGCLFLHDGILWDASLGYRYRRHGDDQCALTFSQRISSRSQASASWHYDAHRHRLVEQRYRFSQRLNGNWNWDGRITVRSHSSREGRLQFALSLSLAM